MSVDDWLKQGYNIEGATKTYFGNEASLEKSEESRPPLKLKNNGGLLSSLFSKKPTKCLKTAILHLKPIKGLKVDIFKELVNLRHLEWFLGKSEESRPPKIEK